MGIPRIEPLELHATLPSGPRNLITDVAGVRVGHATVQQGEVNTGVTAVLPHPGNLFLDKVMASAAVINGFGKSAGILQVQELGTIETPILLTNTLSVGTAWTGLCRYMLEQNPDIPLIACVSRLVGHKGFSMVTDAIHEIMGLGTKGVQMVVLGTGDWQYEEAFRNAQGQYPGRFSAQLTYSAPLSNMIYAGADIFLMPSVSEPCGLSQMIAMRFGTIPVVRETGGLKDSVTPYNKYEGTGRGFTFANISAGDMVWVLREAVDLYNGDQKAWKGLQKEGMTADFSWKNSAQQYIDIYNRILG